MSPDSPRGAFGRPAALAPTAAEAARFDDEAIRGRGVPGAALMENAGRQAALLVHHLHPGGRVVALVGGGNNGGDALVCLRALAAWGRDVAAVVVGRRPEPDLPLHAWDLPQVVAGDWTGPLSSASVIVDGLLGTGLRGAPRGRFAQAIEAANEAPAPVVALDAPSGVDGTTGAVPGACIAADLTVAFGGPKLGTLLHPARNRCGRIVAVEIGLPPGGRAGARLVTPGWVSRRLPRRPSVTHKNAVGTLSVVAGSAMPGAAALAVRSAFRCGAGLVRVCAAPPGAELVAAVPEAIFVGAADERAVASAVEAGAALVAGPGLGAGPEAARELEWALRARGRRAAALDADALTLLAGGVAGGLEATGGDGDVVVTPHPGEMARLAGASVAEVQRDRVGAARSLAESAGVVVLLKGAPTLVADPGGGLLVSTCDAPSDLAAAGMGDVLTGAVGAFLAQRVPAFEAAGLALGTTDRAVAALDLGASLSASDIVEALPAALAERGAGPARLPFPFVVFDQLPPR